MKYADYEKVYIKKEMSLEDWQKNNSRTTENNNLNNVATNGKMSDSDKPKWSVKNKDNIMTKDDYKKLRNLAESENIALSNVKNFDGSPSIVAELIQTAAILQSRFPAVSNERYKLTLAMDGTMNAEDFAITRGRVISLNSNAYRDVNLLQAEYQKLVDEGWFVKGTNYRAVIHHEFGHVVAEIYKIDPMKIACEITGLSKIETLQFVRKNLSKYAFSYDDGSEIISEVFADISTGNPCEFSRKFYNKVLEIVGSDDK